ncbi:MAG TPA: hypothetical protein VFS08_10940 [Gemmatimonadaceae bacterium]|nr:hypothetical protein [Gemmatimonadaceae bacterium]
MVEALPAPFRATAAGGTMSRVIRLTLSSLALVLASACASSTMPLVIEDGHNMRGVVTSLGTGIGIAGEHGGTIEGARDITRATVHTTAGMPVYRETADGSLVPARLDQIEVGDLIRVWHTGVEYRSEPPQYDARQIVILSTSGDQ